MNRQSSSRPGDEIGERDFDETELDGATRAYRTGVFSTDDGRVFLVLCDAQGEPFSYGELTAERAVLLFSQALAWCHEAAVGKAVSQQCGRA